MAKRERQKRYRTTGGAAGLIKVEALVPPEGRDQILSLAAKLREAYRRDSPDRVDVPSIISKVRAACSAQPRRYTVPIDIDKVVVTGVNVPFPKAIDAETLAGAIQRGTVPEGYAAHLERFLGEVSLTDILRFCDRHSIKAPALAKFVDGNRAKLALRRPDLEEHLHALVPHS